MTSALRSYGYRAGAIVSAMAARDAYRWAARRLGGKRKASSYRSRSSGFKRRRYVGRYKRRGRTNAVWRPSHTTRTIRPYARKRVGLPLNTRVSKRAITFNINQFSLNSRTLYSWDLTEITRRSEEGIGNFERLDQRERDRIHLRGFKITGSVRATNDLEEVQCVNIAIISLDSTRSTALWSGNPTQFVGNTAFFRTPGGLNQEAPFGSVITAEEYRNWPINKEVYNVIMRKKVFLHPKKKEYNGSALVNYDDGFKSNRPFDFWVPINRQVRYVRPNSDADRALAGRCALVMWHDALSGTEGTAGIGVGFVELDLKNITYFSEAPM